MSEGRKSLEEGEKTTTYMEGDEGRMDLNLDRSEGQKWVVKYGESGTKGEKYKPDFKRRKSEKSVVAVLKEDRIEGSYYEREVVREKNLQNRNQTLPSENLFLTPTHRPSHKGKSIPKSVDDRYMYTPLKVLKSGLRGNPVSEAGDGGHESTPNRKDNKTKMKNTQSGSYLCTPSGNITSKLNLTTGNILRTPSCTITSKVNLTTGNILRTPSCTITSKGNLTSNIESSRFTSTPTQEYSTEFNQSTSRNNVGVHSLNESLEFTPIRKLKPEKKETYSPNTFTPDISSTKSKRSRIEAIKKRLANCEVELIPNNGKQTLKEKQPRNEYDRVEIEKGSRKDPNTVIPNHQTKECSHMDSQGFEENSQTLNEESYHYGLESQKFEEDNYLGEEDHHLRRSLLHPDSQLIEYSPSLLHKTMDMSTQTNIDITPRLKIVSITYCQTEPTTTTPKKEANKRKGIIETLNNSSPSLCESDNQDYSTSQQNTLSLQKRCEQQQGIKPLTLKESKNQHDEKIKETIQISESAIQLEKIITPIQKSNQTSKDTIQTPDLHPQEMDYGLLSRSIRIYDARMKGYDGYTGINPLRYMGYISFGKEERDPTEGLRRTEIPGLEKFETAAFSGIRKRERNNLDSKKLAEKMRVYGNKFKTGITSLMYVGVDEKLDSLKGEDSYHENPWCDYSRQHFGPDEYEDLLRDDYKPYAGVSNQVTCWALSIWPKNIEWPLHLSLVGNGIELICRTRVSTPTLTNNMNPKPGTWLYYCDVCQQLQIPYVTAIVYCYIFNENKNGDEQYGGAHYSFRRVCFIHFLCMGKDMGRRLPPHLNRMIPLVERRGLPKGLLEA